MSDIETIKFEEAPILLLILITYAGHRKPPSKSGPS